MPLPFPARAGTLRTLLEQEGWKRKDDGHGAYMYSVWQRGKNLLLLVEQVGHSDSLFRPVHDPHSLAVTIARRAQPRGEHQGSRKVTLKLED